jgi:hypothetical protein
MGGGGGGGATSQSDAQTAPHGDFVVTGGGGGGVASILPKVSPDKAWLVWVVGGVVLLIGTVLVVWLFKRK